MPITPFLDGKGSILRSHASWALHTKWSVQPLALWIEATPINEVIAKKVIELAKAGEANPDLLCELALIYFRGQRL